MVVPYWAPAEASTRTIAEAQSKLITPVSGSKYNTQVLCIGALAAYRRLRNIGGRAVVENWPDGEAQVALLGVGEVERTSAVDLGNHFSIRDN